MIKDILNTAEAAMKKTLAHTEHEFSTINTGKAQPSMVESVMVEAYGSMMPLKNCATTTTPDARSIVITPFDKGLLKAIERAILGANIGLNPAVQGAIVRCPIPELTGERRAELVKVANRYAEAGRVQIRNNRRDALEGVKKIQKDKTASEDECKRAEKDVQTLTDKYIGFIDAALKAKESELRG
ncbi:MAG: ribosome recycling factor [Opitutales bacterium]|nr:ribosome recycling factor [Opitutales bacterium]